MSSVSNAATAPDRTLRTSEGDARTPAAAPAKQMVTTSRTAKGPEPEGRIAKLLHSERFVLGAIGVIGFLLLWEAAARAGDIVGRYGGEEFCVLMAQADDEAARRFDQRLRRRLCEAALGELGFEIGYSAGVSHCRDAGDSLDAMLKRADAALYRAKDAGRARTLDTSFGVLQAA